MNSISDLIFFDRPILYLDSVPSTNDFLRENVSEKSLNYPIAVFSEYQTKGRGQREKNWESTKGNNILLSLFYPINCPTNRIQYLNLGIALTLHATIQNELIKEGISEKAYIKWPNDIILQDKKIAGILIETSISEAKIAGIYVGIGMNVLQFEFGLGLMRAASMKSLYPTILWDRSSIVEILLQKLERFFTSFETTKKDFHSQYISNLYKFNKQIEIKENGKFINKGIDLEGNLVLENTKDQSELKLNSTNGIDWDY